MSTKEEAKRLRNKILAGVAAVGVTVAGVAVGKVAKKNAQKDDKGKGQTELVSQAAQRESHSQDISVHAHVLTVFENNGEEGIDFLKEKGYSFVKRAFSLSKTGGHRIEYSDVFDKNHVCVGVAEIEWVVPEIGINGMGRPLYRLRDRVDNHSDNHPNLDEAEINRKKWIEEGRKWKEAGAGYKPKAHITLKVLDNCSDLMNVMQNRKNWNETGKENIILSEGVSIMDTHIQSDRLRRTMENPGLDNKGSRIRRIAEYEPEVVFETHYYDNTPGNAQKQNHTLAVFRNGDKRVR